MDTSVLAMSLLIPTVMSDMTIMPLKKMKSFVHEAHSLDTPSSEARPGTTHHRNMQFHQ